jgi:hypothetical protein
MYDWQVVNGCYRCRRIAYHHEFGFVFHRCSSSSPRDGCKISGRHIQTLLNRGIARFVYVPFTLFQQGPHSEEAQAAVEWYGVMLEQAIVDLRQALRDNIQVTDPDTIFATRNYIRVTPAKARELVERLNALQQEIIAADDPDGPVRFAYTSVLAPASFPAASPTAGAARGPHVSTRPPRSRRARRLRSEPGE